MGTCRPGSLRHRPQTPRVCPLDHWKLPAMDRTSAASSSPNSRATRRPATTAERLQFATATVTCATTAATAWAVRKDEPGALALGFVVGYFIVAFRSAKAAPLSQSERRQCPDNSCGASRNQHGSSPLRKRPGTPPGRFCFQRPACGLRRVGCVKRVSADAPAVRLPCTFDGR